MDDKEKQMLTDLHQALMVAPVPGTDPLVVRIQRVVQSYERTGWFFRIMIWFFAALGSVAVTITALWRFFMIPGTG